MSRLPGSISTYMACGLFVALGLSASAQEAPDKTPPPAKAPEAPKAKAESAELSADQKQKVGELETALKAKLGKIRAERAAGSLDRTAARKQLLQAHLEHRKNLSALLTPAQLKKLSGRSERAPRGEGRRGEGRRGEGRRGEGGFGRGSRGGRGFGGPKGRRGPLGSQGPIEKPSTAPKDPERTEPKGGRRGERSFARGGRRGGEHGFGRGEGRGSGERGFGRGGRRGGERGFGRGGRRGGGERGFGRGGRRGGGERGFGRGGRRGGGERDFGHDRGHEFRWLSSDVARQLFPSI